MCSTSPGQVLGLLVGENKMDNLNNMNNLNITLEGITVPKHMEELCHLSMHIAPQGHTLKPR